MSFSTRALDIADLANGFYRANETAPAGAFAQDSQLSLRAFPEWRLLEVEVPILPLVLANRTKDVIELPSCDRKLFMVEEARDVHGQWRPIHGLPWSTCGNSLYYVRLKPGEAYQFTARRQSGKFKTMLRFKLLGEKPIYSNEFEGSVDPSQFDVPKSRFDDIEEAFLWGLKRHALLMRQKQAQGEAIAR